MSHDIPTRSNDRRPDALRPVSFVLDFVPYPAGSVLVAMGNTRVLCNATVEEGVPRWMTEPGIGWVTAEYAMLPAATHTRGKRERGQPSGRSAEIQRLVGRSLRAAVDRRLLGERTVLIDCDVLQADGGTRTAAINGGFVALALACARLMRDGAIATLPIVRGITAVSCGVLGGTPLLDIDYQEDAGADVDLNMVMTSAGDIVEIQGTGEGSVLSRTQLDTLIGLATEGCVALSQAQARALDDYPELSAIWSA